MDHLKFPVEGDGSVSLVLVCWGNLPEQSPSSFGLEGNYVAIWLLITNLLGAFLDIRNEFF